MTENLTALHECYVRLTGYEIRLSIHERAFYEFAKAGFTPDDLRCVLEFLKAQNKKRDCKYDLKIHKIIYDLERFDSFLGEAKAIERNRVKRTANQSIMESWRPPTGEAPVTGTARHVSALFVNPPKI